MTNMKLVFLIALMAFFCSCDSKKSKSQDYSDSVIRIDLLSNPKSTIKKLSEFAKDVEYIPLQTTKNSLLGEFALKIVNVDNRIYIHNSGLNGGIMCFDTDGKFLFKNQNYGRGPGQYTTLSDFDVSSDNKIMTILSNVDQKLFIYNISETGSSFERSFSLKETFPLTIGMVPETNYAFLAIDPRKPDTPILSLLINTDGDTIHFKPNIYRSRQDKPMAYARWSLVYLSQKLVCFREYFSDTVFYVDAINRSFKPRIIFDTHGILVTPEMIGHPERKKENTIALSAIYETSRYVFYYLSYSKNNDVFYNCHLFDKTTNTTYELDTETFDVTIANIPRPVDKIKFKDDLKGGPDFTQDVRRLNAHCSAGKMFSMVDAITLKNYVTGEDFKNARITDSKKEQLKKLAESLTDIDNPVLVIVTPKD